MKVACLKSFLLSFAVLFGNARTPAVSITIEPPTPLIEYRDQHQLLQFDFAVHNTGGDTLRLTEIELSVYDSGGRLALRKTVNSDGLRPGIEVVAPALLHPGEVMDVFNPFFLFGLNVPLRHLEFAFRYVVENSAKPSDRNRQRLPMDFDFEQHITVTPADYRPKTSLYLPLHGRILVWEGHDFYAHHRRIPLDAEKTQKIGIRGANAERYASDLVIVDERGAVFHGDAFHKTNYYVYGQPIYAPGDGRIYASRNDVPDNEYDGRGIHYPELPPGVDEDLGNFVIIDHGNGEFSVLPHMKPNSVRVKVGDRVRAGQVIGEVGFSGDAIFPHVHYSLVSGPDAYSNEGLPAYFKGVTRILGSAKEEKRETTLETGDIVEPSRAVQ